MPRHRKPKFIISSFIIISYLIGVFYSPLVHILHDIHHMLAHTQHLHQGSYAGESQHHHDPDNHYHSHIHSYDHKNHVGIPQSKEPESANNHGHNHNALVDLSLKSIEPGKHNSHSHDSLILGQIEEHVKSLLNNLTNPFYQPKRYILNNSYRADLINLQPVTPPPRSFIS